MLGTTKLQTLFGALRRGANTAGEARLTAMLKAFSSEGLSIVFLSSKPGSSKIPTDYRTEKQKKDAEAQALAEGKPEKKGFYLATNDSAELVRMAKNAREMKGATKEDALVSGGLDPINFGLVPDQSGVVVIDCDTAEETLAFKNFFSDFTGNEFIRNNIDNIRPSVMTPGVVEGGEWHEVSPGGFVDDYGSYVYVPPIYENRGGRVLHANGGHWYFFYPEGYSLPEGTSGKVTISYSSYDRSPYLEKRRQLIDYLTDNPQAEDRDKIIQELNDVEEQLREIKDKARNDFFDKVKVPGNTSSFTVMMHSCCVSIPPSSRYEGHYEIGSGEFDWEPWLTSLIATGGLDISTDIDEVTEVTPSANDRILEDRTPRVVEDEIDDEYVDGFSVLTEGELDELNQLISDKWAWRTRWFDILSRHGWSLTGNDTCGCEIYEAPGHHTSPKSATAHDNGCSLGASSLGRLHIWTDNPPEEFEEYLARGKRDFSKLNVISILEHGGSAGEAMRALDIDFESLPSFLGDTSSEFNDFLLDKLNGQPPISATQEPLQLVKFGDLGEEEPPRYIIENTIEDGSFSAIIGAPGTGKSFVAIDMACALATGTTWMGAKCRKEKVAYLAGEGRSGVIERMKAWVKVRENELSKEQLKLINNNLFMANRLPNISSMMPEGQEFQQMMDIVKEVGATLLIIDTWSRANAGADENDAGNVSGTIQTLQVLTRMTGCSVLVVHHTAKNADYARGSSALNGALDTEILVKHEEGVEELDGDPTDPNSPRSNKVLSVDITKQKNAEGWAAPKYCRITTLGSDKVKVDETGKPIEDEDGFITKVRAPAALSDMDGTFMIKPDDGFGGAANWELEDMRVIAGIPADITILEEILAVVTEHSPSGISKAQLATFVKNSIIPEHGKKHSPELPRVISGLINTAISNKMLLFANNKVRLTREGTIARTPKEVADMLKESENQQ